MIMETLETYRQKLLDAIDLELQKPHPSLGHLIKQLGHLQSATSTSEYVRRVEFSNQTQVTVNHNLSKNPVVRVYDSDNKIIPLVEVTFPNLNSFIVSFDNPLTGFIEYF